MWFLAFGILCLVAAAEQCEAAFDCAAVANTGNRFLLTHRNFWFYDGFAAERRLGSCYKTAPQDISLQALAQLPTPSPD
ncbi:hypothetical protein C1X69_25100 [Pseudomonas sp. FW305-67]|nr:hypothetical protein C1X70_24195 [Pseudomonas sp. FW305-53]PMY88293.1 hypothetical protein C1X68_03440 [Pseudomonas sp. FW303-C2]PMY93767.1 hypothetical protein C1X67_07455 [Pseudomonas sp. FW305-62]PNA39474.1 hypothetical protein C1X71_26170 [Pseudomonas sp. FW306-2-2C-A10BC]PNA82197.1 hypothetical protein C1X66_27080 [Pseudomonas sp. MPR-R3B]PNB14410.1 hypothetical protein C1X69_25100 [Pseudomonas sp. FW305-67]